MNNKRLISTVCSALLVLPSAAMATNGYFSHGYGTKSKGLAGGGVALPQDAMASATNPAGLAYVGDRFDLGLALFSPIRGYSAPASNVFPSSGTSGESVESSKNLFYIPHFAVNYHLDADNAVGVALYGNGGMNTTYYASDTAGGIGVYQRGNTGVDLMQLFINTSFAHKLNDNVAVGAGVIVAAQRFAARGFDSFGAYSSDSAHLTNNGFSYSFGAGVKLGIQGKVSNSVTLAASYQSRINMSKFDEYRGLFAKQGEFDIPPTATIGLAWKATPKSHLTFDIQKTWFSDVASVGNPMSLLAVGNLGTNNGAGFGWKDMTVYKLGYQWQSSPKWTWRVGYSKTKQPITAHNVLFNVVAPAVVDQHFTFGFTHPLSKRSEFNFAAFYAPKKTVVGDGGSNLSIFTPANSVKIYMHEFEVEASWGYRF